MKSRTTLILVLLAVLAGAGAWWLGRSDTDTVETASSVSLVFPRLADKLASARRVEIQSKGATLFIDRTDKGWGLPARGGYPVREDKLRTLFTALTELRATEPRTAEPAQYARLGVDDPADPNATAALLKILDDKGNILAQLIVGHRSVSTRPDVPTSVYIRRPGEARAWLAEGDLEAEVDPQLWLGRTIANIDHGQIRTIEVDRGTEHLVLANTDGKMELTAPADHPPLDPYGVEGMFRALENLTLEDVRPLDQRPGTVLGTDRLTLADGGTITVTVAGYDNPAAKPDTPPEVWISFAVTGDAPALRALGAHTAGWTFKVGNWEEKALVPLLDALKAEPPAKP